MTLKSLLLTLPLVLSPVMSFAQECHGDRADQQAMSCADGTIWDGATATCVPVPLETS